MFSAGPVLLPSAAPSDAWDNPYRRSSFPRVKSSGIMFFVHDIIYDIVNNIVYYITFEFRVPYWTDGRQGLSYGGFAGVLQHI
jgi:hypothetical protein